MPQEERKLLKSYSVFTKKKTHQSVNDGTIYERDWLTTGGVDKFLPKQKPYYHDGNFIITANDDAVKSKDYETDDFEKINGNDEWTLEEIEKNEKNEESDIANDLLHNNIYDLRKFAYFGSCVELFRGTINGLLERFPGELYFSDSLVYYTFKEKGKEPIPKVLSVGSYQYVVSNPFNINIHLENVREVENYLRYFANEGYKNYEIIIGDSSNGTDVTSFSVSKVNECAAVGDEIATITINSYTIKYVKGEGENYYLHNSPNSKIHIRPKKEFIDNFFESLDSFEEIMLNRNTYPKYTAKFNLIEQTDYGVKTVCESFTFPTGLGDYNIGGSTETFSSYLNKLINVAEKYDEMYTDNIYRMLTHETLKNFDFTIDIETQNTDSYQEGHDRLKKLLRIYGREFDDIRLNIEKIKDVSLLSYNELTNEQRKYLKDKLVYEGFDLRNIYPILSAQGDGNNCYKFSYDKSSTYKPFKADFKYYYDNGEIKKANTDSNEIITIQTINGKTESCIAKVFKKYNSSNTYNTNYINDEFFKRLRLNSRNLFRHKGSAYGIEKILSMFGLSSKRMIQRMDENSKNLIALKSNAVGGNPPNFNYDYDISECSIQGVGTISGDDVKKIQYYNSIKLLEFNDDSLYAGLPVIEIDGILYPFFDTSKPHDGNMAYQMNGGWLKYEFEVFNKDNCPTEGDFTYTIRDVRAVNSIDELIQIPYEELYDGMVVKILNKKKDIAIANSNIYNILYDSFDTSKSNPFIYLSSENKKFYVGNNSYDEITTVTYNNNHKEINVTYSAKDMEEGALIKVYLNNSTPIPFDYNGFTDGNNNTEVSQYKKYTPNNRSYSYNTLDNWSDITEDELNGINTAIDYYEGNNPHNGIPFYDDGEEYLNRFRHLFKYSLENDLFDIRCFGSRAQYEAEKQDIYNLGFNIGTPTCKSIADLDNEKANIVNDVKQSLSIMPTKRINIDFSPLFGRINATTEFKKYFLSVIMNYCQQFIPSTAICHIS